jgi:hypothetical protein
VVIAVFTPPSIIVSGDRNHQGQRRPIMVYSTVVKSGGLGVLASFLPAIQDEEDDGMDDAPNEPEPA